MHFLLPIVREPSAFVGHTLLHSTPHQRQSFIFLQGERVHLMGHGTQSKLELLLKIVRTVS